MVMRNLFVKRNVFATKEEQVKTDDKKKEEEFIEDFEDDFDELDFEEIFMPHAVLASEKSPQDNSKKDISRNQLDDEHRTEEKNTKNLNKNEREEEEEEITVDDVIPLNESCFDFGDHYDIITEENNCSDSRQTTMDNKIKQKLTNVASLTKDKKSNSCEITKNESDRNFSEDYSKVSKGNRSITKVPLEQKRSNIVYWWRRLAEPAILGARKSTKSIDFTDITHTIELMQHPTPAIYTSLNAWLKKSSLEWKERFLDRDALEIMLDTLVVSSGSKPQFSEAILQLEVVLCIKSILNCKVGLTYLVYRDSYLLRDLIISKFIIL